MQGIQSVFELFIEAAMTVSSGKPFHSETTLSAFLSLHLAKADGTLLYATFNEESTGAIHNFERFVLSVIWGNTTLQKHLTVVINA